MQYRLGALIGRGASGRVLEVFDLATGERRAMKIVAADAATVVEEYALLARLSHPSLPRVFDVGRTTEAIDGVPAGAPYFVAEWIEGAPADAAPWDPARTWSALAELAGALATIHAAGLVHGDVAPQNVLVAPSRVVLVDLGLASGSGARGTPAYLAPEALAGRVEPRGDLYGLGATIVRLVTGRAPFEAATLGELVQRVVTGAIPRLDALPAPLADLVTRLVARDVEARPASAIAVLDELDQLAPALGITARVARPKVGPPPAPATWPGAAELADAIARDAEQHGAAIVAGGAGSGAREVADVALRRTQLLRVGRGEGARTVLAGGLDDVAGRLGVDARDAGYVERAIRAMVASDAAVVLALGDDPRAARAIAALERAASSSRAIVIAIVDAGTGERVHVAGALDEAAIAAIATRMLGAPVPQVWARALHAASGGLPLTAIELLRSIAGDPDPLAVEWSARSSTGATARRAAQLARVSDGARQLVCALAIWGGRARVDRALATVRGAGGAASLADIVELERVGLARREDEELSIDRATADAAPTGDTAALVTAALAASADAPPERRAAILEHGDLDPELAARACDVADALLARGRADRAHGLATHVLAQRPSARAEMLAARTATLLARYPEAIAHARRALEAGAEPIAATLAIARAAQRAGDLDTAEASLAELHAAHPEHGEVAGAYARLLVTRSRYADARRIATTGRAPLAGLRAEAAGLAAFYLGALDDADRAFAALEAGADDAAIGRAQSLRGMVAQQRGQLAIAGERYREAVRRLSDVGERHAAATAELNLGTVLSERGRSSEALPWLAAAERTFEALGATTELVAARLDRGNALIAVGEPAEALRAAEAAIASAGGAPHLRAFALVVAGDARRHLGDAGGAERSFREALATATDAHARASAYIALAESALPIEPGVDVAALCASDDDRDRWTLARARGQLAGAPAGDDAAVARACAEIAARAEAADRLERAFRGHALAIALAARANPRSDVERAQLAVLAKTWAARARAAHGAIVAAAAPAFRAAIERDPDLALLPREPVAPAPRARRDDAPELRRLLTLSRRLNTETSVERILDEVIDTAIELSHAERGFLLLRQGSGELAPVVSRNFAATDLDATSTVSRSIAERAAQTGEAVVTVDAGVDERFGAAASVAALRLRSVLAVPLRQRGAITGCLYVDHRLRGGAFDDDAAGVLGELADIAAIAIENARLADDVRRSTHAIDALNARLSEELAERDAELVRVKSDLPDRDRLRHTYPQIIGRSPAMMRMLDVVDRATATSLPIVVVGESGTGKELVARALHDHGARKAGPFVAINCSAVPEPLLESELFGHVRGAFTGAERDRRGLFEVADGGTLFLDEIADTSPAMQAKLLRVLQDGLVRRVGDTKTHKVDVRVIAASQRGLGELAAAGRFRDDLRFRLEVIAIAVPPLRERDGDIPLLVEALLARIAAPKPPPRLTRAAARALGQHRWAGNVRELENALSRGLAMGGDVIDLSDLPETIGAASARPEPAKPAVADDLRLKPAIVATEQAYISAAMGRAKGNQTLAARLLGLSRFGLQKKLRRLAGDDDDDAD